MQDYLETVSTYGSGPQNLEDFIALKKLMSKVQRIPKKKQDKKRCFLCNKKNIKFCNSHTIPRFILKNIATDGKLDNTQIFNTTPLIDTETGVNNTNTFHSICTYCDSDIFKEYENPENYNNEPNQIMMKQIALKNHLSRAYKHNKEKKTYNYILREFTNTNIHMGFQAFIKPIIQTNEYNRIYNNKRAKLIKNSLKLSQNMYKLCYYRELGYIVPYSLQSHSILYFDFDDNILVDPFKIVDFNINDEVHLCIFPLESTSIIFAFCDASIDIYDDLFIDLNEKDDEDQLSIINFIVFAYFEDVYMHKNINSQAVENINLKKLTQEQLLIKSEPSVIKNIPRQEHEKHRIEAINEKISLKNHSSIPNLLSAEYKI